MLGWKVLESGWAVQYGAVPLLFLHVQSRKGLPKQTDVKKMLDWKVWKREWAVQYGVVSRIFFHAPWQRPA